MDDTVGEGMIENREEGVERESRKRGMQRDKGKRQRKGK